MKFYLFAVALVAAACAPSAPSDVSGRWNVQHIAGASLGEGVDIWFEIDADTQRIAGFTGCNNFSADLAGFENALSIGPVSEETGECASEAARTDETRFLLVLPNVQRTIVHGDALEMTDAQRGPDALIRARRVETAGG